MARISSLLSNSGTCAYHLISVGVNFWEIENAAPNTLGEHKVRQVLTSLPEFREGSPEMSGSPRELYFLIQLVHNPGSGPGHYDYETAV